MTWLKNIGFSLKNMLFSYVPWKKSKKKSKRTIPEYSNDKLSDFDPEIQSENESLRRISQKNFQRKPCVNEKNIT
jgi:hypothetical protein